MHRPVVVSLVVLSLAACGSPSASTIPTPEPLARPTSAATAAPTADISNESEQGVLISLWVGWSPERIRALNDLIRDFQARHPTTEFSVAYVRPENLPQSIAEAESEDSLPTLFLAPSSWGSMLYEQGYIQDLSGLPVEEARAFVHPLAWTQSGLDEQVWGIPLQLQGDVLYRNRDLVAIPSNTVENLVEIAQGLRGTGAVGIALDLGYATAGPLASSCGGGMMTRSDPPDFDGEIAGCWLNLLHLLGQAGPVTLSTNEDLEQFRAGQAAWLIESSERYEELRETVGPDSLSVDPWPLYAETGQPISGPVWTENLYVRPGLTTEELAEAWDFIGFMLSADSQTALALAGNIPVHTALPPIEGELGRMHETLLEGVPYPLWEPRPEYVEILERAARAVAVQGTPIEAAIANALEELANLPDV